MIIETYPQKRKLQVLEFLGVSRAAYYSCSCMHLETQKEKMMINIKLKLTQAKAILQKLEDRKHVTGHEENVLRYILRYEIARYK